MFCLTVQRFLARVQSPTFTIYRKFLLKNIMAVLTPNLVLQKDLPSKHLLVFKTSWRHGLKTSSKRLQRNNFSSSKTSWRHLEDILQIRPEDVLKTPWKTYWKRLGGRKIVRLETSCLQDVFKTCLQDVFKTFTGNIYWEYLYLKYLKSVSDKSVSHISNLTNEGESKMH